MSLPPPSSGGCTFSGFVDVVVVLRTETVVINMVIPVAEVQSPAASQVGIASGPLVEIQRDGSEKLHNFPQDHTACKWWSLDNNPSNQTPNLDDKNHSLMLSYVRPRLHTCI